MNNDVAIGYSQQFHCAEIQRPFLSSLAWLVSRSISWIRLCSQVPSLRCPSSVKELGSSRSFQDHLVVPWKSWSSLELKIHRYVVISCMGIVIFCRFFQKYRQVVACPSSTSRTTLMGKLVLWTTPFSKKFVLDVLNHSLSVIVHPQGDV